MSMTMTSPAPSPRNLPVPRWFRASFTVASRLAPAMAGAWAQRMFFTPNRLPVRREEREFLARGVRFDVETRHGRVAAWAWGSGPTVLLAHGWSGHAGQMTPLARALVDAGFRAVALDMPAHGASAGKLTSIVHFADALGDAAPLFAPLRGTVAHSLGAAAATFAMANGRFTTSRAAFIAPPADLETFWDRFRRGTGLSPSGWDAMKKTSERWLGVPFEACVPRLLAPRLATPLLVVHDQDDREIPQAEGRELAAVWPGARFQGTAGLGHARILRDPGTIAAVVRFLGEPDASGRSSGTP